MAIVGVGHADGESLTDNASNNRVPQTRFEFTNPAGAALRLIALLGGFMDFRYTKTERRWGFRFESIGLDYVLHIGVNLKVKAVRFCLLGFGFHAGRIPYHVECSLGKVSGGEHLEKSVGSPLSLQINVSKFT